MSYGEKTHEAMTARMKGAEGVSGRVVIPPGEESGIIEQLVAMQKMGRAWATASLELTNGVVHIVKTDKGIFMGQDIIESRYRCE